MYFFHEIYSLLQNIYKIYMLSKPYIFLVISKNLTYPNHLFALKFKKISRKFYFLILDIKLRVYKYTIFIKRKLILI